MSDPAARAAEIALHADAIDKAITHSMRITGSGGYSHDDFDNACRALTRLLALLKEHGTSEISEATSVATSGGEQL